MPGAGSYPAGAVPAGYDPGSSTTSAGRLLPRAPLFQLGTADFPVNAVGQFVDVHPNDQWVALQLSTRFGTLYSVPGMGHKLRSVTRVSPAKVLSLVTDMVQQALSDRVQSGDVRIDKIEVDTSHRGTLLVAVSYTNLATIPARRATIRRNLGA